MQFTPEGKTKLLTHTGVPGQVRITAKPILSKGDGATIVTLDGKDVFATMTAANVFKLMKACGIGTGNIAFDRQDSPNSFLAPECSMLPFEVVVRGYADGSFLKRNPSMKQYGKLSPLVVEFYLKTKDKVWGEAALLCDDPLLRLSTDEGGWRSVKLYTPSSNVHFHEFELRDLAKACAAEGFVFTEEAFTEMAMLAARSYTLLHRAWSGFKCRLLDIKFEFGIHNGKLYIADTADNDSWRLLDEHGLYLCKQAFRNGTDLAIVLENYRRVAAMTRSFKGTHEALHRFATYGYGYFPRIRQDWLHEPDQKKRA